MAITQRGKLWEWSHSWWLPASAMFLGMGAWLGFLAAGYGVRSRKWLVAGVLYFVTGPAIFLGVFGPSGTRDREARERVLAAGGTPEQAAAAGAPTTPFEQTASIVYFTVWIASMIHAFRARPEYLIRLDARMRRGGDLGGDPYAHIRAEVGSEHQAASVPLPPRGAFTAPAPPPPAVPRQVDVPAPAPAAAAPVDLNNAPEAEIAALPGIGPVLAQRVVQERRMRGGFRSVEEVAQALALKPHVITRLWPLVTLGPPPPAPPPSGRGGRRVVDF